MVNWRIILEICERERLFLKIGNGGNSDYPHVLRKGM